jgi:hypothetical protein
MGDEYSMRNVFKIVVGKSGVPRLGWQHHVETESMIWGMWMRNQFIWFRVRSSGEILVKAIMYLRLHKGGGAFVDKMSNCYLSGRNLLHGIIFSLHMFSVCDTKGIILKVWGSDLIEGQNGCCKEGQDEVLWTKISFISKST